MTEMAVDRVLQNARQFSTADDHFGVSYVDALIGRLDQRSISAERRAGVVKMLKKGLRQPLELWHGRIKQLGKLPRSPRSPSIAPTTEKSTPTQRVCEPTPSSSEALYVGVPHVDPGESVHVKKLRNIAKGARTNGRHTRNLNAEGDKDESEPEQEERNDDDYTPPKPRIPAGKQKSGAVSSQTKETKLQENIRLYGAARAKTTFDIFARCTISAWGAAPKSTDNPFDIRHFAKLKWRLVSWELKSEWQKLFEDRFTLEIDLVATSRRLLMSQGLLAMVVPPDRLAAARLYFEQETSHASRAGAHRASSPTESGQTGTSPPQQPRVLRTSHALVEDSASQTSRDQGVPPNMSRKCKRCNGLTRTDQTEWGFCTNSRG